MATADNLTLLRDHGFSYLVNDSRKHRRRYHPEFADQQAFEPLPDPESKSPVQIRVLQELALNGGVSGKHTNKESKEVIGTILLCRSTGRMEKEKAMFRKAEVRLQEAAVKLDERLKKGLLIVSKKTQQAIGRLKAQHPRVQRFYVIELSDASKSMIRLAWERKDVAYQENENLFGCYSLRTDRQDLTPAELWRVHI
ncbi:MAG: hypothetical protein ACKVKT_11020 [Rhodospirillales bacterium]